MEFTIKLAVRKQMTTKLTNYRPVLSKQCNVDTSKMKSGNGCGKRGKKCLVATQVFILNVDLAKWLDVRGSDHNSLGKTSNSQTFWGGGNTSA